MDAENQSNVRSVRYTVEVSRLIWGDHGPRFLAEVGCLEDHLTLLRQDDHDRFMGKSRLRIYSFKVLEHDGHGVSVVVEIIAYGDEESLERSVTGLWAQWTPHVAVTASLQLV